MYRYDQEGGDVVEKLDADKKKTFQKNIGTRKTYYIS